ncbi:hypothetical protein GFS24_22660 [Chitinophaga sp. SYP-B3965]|uniref:hypothetical protein n=1 Tax=Chitinophaga sp. SYP-B3965 TaxID=2663120 RepID=UPI0012998FF6|nr:hypothetical protein [Chitinophaga sp. SYP-B3965]MRG47940.1 hypothetical protein [Chitinophaga sp. SYP-B3965]
MKPIIDLVRTLILCSSLFFSYSLKLSAQNTGSELERFVVQIGDFRLSAGEYNYYYNGYVNEFRDKYKGLPGVDSVEAWKKRFIMKMYLLADAYKNAYFSDERINKFIKHTGEAILTQRSGALLKSLTTVSVSDEEVVEGYNKRKKKYIISYAVINPATVQSRFDSLINHEGIQATLIWPVSFLGADELWDMETGEISHAAVTGKGLVVFRIDSINSNQQPVFDSCKNNIRKVITYYKSGRKEGELFRKIERELNIEYDSLNISQLFKYLQLIDFNRDNICDYNTPIDTSWSLVKYTIEGNILRKNVSELYDAYRYLPLRKKINAVDQLYSILFDMTCKDYLYDLAEKKGLASDVNFLTSQKMARNSMVYAKYKEDKFKAGKDEINTYYNIHQLEYPDAITVLSFSSYPEALQARKILLGNHMQDAGSLKLTGLKSRKDYAVKTDSTFSFLMNTVLPGLKAENISLPVYMTREYKLFMPGPAVHYNPIPLNLVEGYIINKLYQQKEDKRIAELMAQKADQVKIDI